MNDDQLSGTMKRRSDKNGLNIELNLIGIILGWIWKKLRPMAVNYKTTIGGIGGILTGLSMGWGELVALTEGQTPDWDILLQAGGLISLGYVGLTARSQGVTSEQTLGHHIKDEMHPNER
jgi:hypothetical protein